MESRRRGGIRQRMAEATPLQTNSQLAKHLALEWAWGSYSPQEVQQLAALACSDLMAAGGEPLPALASLSSLGSHGEHPNNMNRDLLSLMPRSFLPAAKTFVAPFKNNLGEIEPKQTDMLYPHEWFAAFYTHYDEAFKKNVCPSREFAADWWSQFDGSQRLHGHPLVEREHWRELCVPISIHGDGVPVTGCGKKWKKTLDVWSWSSVFVTGGTLDTMFLIWSHFPHTSCTLDGSNRTCDQFYKELRWSLYWLWLGQWPDRNADGQAYPRGSAQAAKALTPLADGHFAILWVLKGDLDYFHKELKLPHYSNAAPCCFCPADAVMNPWSEFRVTHASWFTQIFGSDHVLAHPFFSLPGVSVLTIFADLTHVKHMGTDTYFYGSVLWLMVYKVFGGNPDVNCRSVFERICRFNKEHRVSNSFGALKISMFVPPRAAHTTYPKLKGKSAEVASVGGALLHIWNENMDGSNLQHKQIQLCLMYNVTIERILSEHRLEAKLPSDVAAEFKDSVFKFLLVYNALSTQCAADNVKLFSLTIKFHYLAHCGLQASDLNPRTTWCYRGEDFMQKMKKLVSSCVRGNNALQACRKMRDKYAVALTLQWHSQ